MHQHNIDKSIQSLHLMSAMARPKSLEIRREQLLRVSHMSTYAAISLVGIALCLTWLLGWQGKLGQSVGFIFLAMAEAVLVMFLGRLIPHRLGDDSPNLPKNIATLNVLFTSIVVAIVLTFGPVAAYAAHTTSDSWVQNLTLMSFGGASLMAYLMGIWLTPFVLLMTIPLLWLATSALAGDLMDSRLLTQTAIISGFVYPLAAFWFMSSGRYLIQKLQFQKLIDYQENARSAADELNTKLAHEIAQREMVEYELRDIQKDLENTIRDRTEALTETNRALNQQIKLRKNISDALVKSQSRLSQAIEATGLALWDWDIPTDSVYQSYFHPVFGPREISATEFLRRVRDLIHPDDFEKASRQISNCVKGLIERCRLQYRIRLDDQTWMWVEDCGKVVNTDSKGRVTRILGTRRDITLDQKREEQLRLAKSVFDNTSEGIFALDNELRFLTVNNAFQRITGYHADEIIGGSLEQFSKTPNKEKVFSLIRDELVLKGSWQGELYEKRKNGDYYSQWLHLKAITDNDGKISHYAGLFSDLTERKETNEKLHYLLNYDDLTGLANRVLFKDRLHKRLRQMREHGDKVALLIIDVDRFRQINESLGHDLGDELLKQIALRISDNSQDADTVARLGSDEFAIIMTAKNRVQVAKFCELLLDSLKAPYQVDAQEYFISTSIGITQAPDNGREIQSLMQQANTAVRQAKYLGGNTYEFYSRMLQNISSRRLSMESELRKAVQREQLEVYYQPKVSLQSGFITGAEALVRWRHPELGMIPPADFVPVAEESGLIMAIGEQVLHKACTQARIWNDMGLGNIKVSVNVSAYQLRQANLPLVVRDVLKSTELSPDQLDLELTESALMENASHTQAMLNRLRNMGISITIDDFGTGYSSLAYLKRFPISALKIDRMFISDVHQNADDASITKAIILLANSLNLEVIAEGVELKEHLDFLTSLDCHTIQGFLVARPLDSVDMTVLLQSQMQKSSLSFLVPN
ncbi:signal transduction protein [Hahella sp. CCB-MM4]|uniref:GGDEF domain-containing phosphodiesterase n=1 Tax=Hahella sp. (strain CCB-MM4) TaxID=1926491 RepID=UPI000B9AE754|nr:GGDEF domain-containing phosphodiesterase [Hahella sp. CCB-MM4]OZG75086.1 signal transduction protein [Hahella sp. CCB-MM4]